MQGILNRWKSFSQETKFACALDKTLKNRQILQKRSWLKMRRIRIPRRGNFDFFKTSVL